MLIRKTPLKTRKPMKRRRKADTRSPAEKDYYTWLLDQPCVAHGTTCEERHHVRRHQFGACGAKKPPDWFAIPLGEKTHKLRHDKGRLAWEAVYGPETGFILPLWERYGLEKVPVEMQERLRKYNLATG